MIVIAGTATIKPESWEAAVQRAAEMTAASEAEAGCLSYRFYVQPDDRCVFFLFEEWASQEALDRHFEQEHTRSFSQYLGTILTGPLAIKRYEVASVAPL